MHVLRLDAVYRGTFVEPVSALLGNFPGVYDAIYRRFAPVVRPDEIRWEGAQSSDFMVVCNFLSRGLAVRYKLSEVEAWTSVVELLKEGLWSDLADRSAAVPRDLKAETAYKKHSFIVAAHWEVPENSTFDRYISGWEGKHPNGFALHAIAFVSTMLDNAPVTIEFQPSLLYDDPAKGFVRVTCELPGQMAVLQACEAAREAILGTLDSFNLDLGIS